MEAFSLSLEFYGVGSQGLPSAFAARELLEVD